MKKLVILFLIILLITNVYASCNETQININTANAEDLDKLYGIGETKAQAIIDARPFGSVDNLIKVYGIGEKTLDKIEQQGLACVDEEIQEEEEENSEESEQTSDEEEENTSEIDEEAEEKNEKEINPIEDKEDSLENIYVKNLTLKTIELNANSKDIKSVDNKKILKRNLAFAGIVTFCVTFGGALFLMNTRRRKSEFN